MRTKLLIAVVALGLVFGMTGQVGAAATDVTDSQSNTVSDITSSLQPSDCFSDGDGDGCGGDDGGSDGGGGGGCSGCGFEDGH